MCLLRHLKHWLNGQGPHLQTAEFVPETYSIRLSADTFPWDALVYAFTGETEGSAVLFSRARRDRADGPGRNW